MRTWRTRYVARWAYSLMTAGLIVAAVACGQPDAPRAGAGAVPASVTAVIPTFTATPNYPPSVIAATQTAFAALPTKPGPDSPSAPTIEATLALPRPTTNSNVPEKPTVAVPTIRPYDPAQPCIIGSLASGDGRSFSLVTQTAGTILVGTVVQVLPARWTTPDGQRPARPCTGPPHFGIVTPVRIRVEQVVKGQIVTADITVDAFGGTIGQDRYFYVDRDNPTVFQVNERVIVFLNKNSIIGRYDIRADGTAVNRYAPYESTTLSQLLSEIAAITNTGSPTLTPALPMATPSTP